VHLVEHYTVVYPLISGGQGTVINNVCHMHRWLHHVECPMHQCPMHQCPFRSRFVVEHVPDKSGEMALTLSGIQGYAAAGEGTTGTHADWMLTVASVRAPIG